MEIFKERSERILNIFGKRIFQTEEVRSTNVLK
jgi:hypothetical protein